MAGERVSEVSVLMPVYNAEATIASAVRSVLRQTSQSLELVIVNDGSTDGTAAILADCARRDARVRVIERRNGGIVAALNEGWQACKGRYIARMDADDLCLPWRLARQIAYMGRHPDIVASGTAILPFQSRRPFIGLPARFPADEAGVQTRLLFNPPIMHPTAMFRRAAFGVEPPYTSAMPQAEDYELWSRLAVDHRLGNDSAICLLYRRSATSVSSARRGEQVRQAGELRLRNLARLCGETFALQHAELHLELMQRHYAPASLLTRMPAHVAALLELPNLSRPIVQQVWLSYCLGYAQTGGDGAELYRRCPNIPQGLRALALRLARGWT